MNTAHPSRASKDRRESPLQPLPAGAFLVFVGGICLALAVSGFFTVRTLTRLEAAFLENRAREVAAALDLQARGPGRRNNPEVWQQLVSDYIVAHPDSAEYLALLDGPGTVLAEAGDRALGVQKANPGFLAAGGRRVFVYDFPLAGARPGPPGAQVHITGWRLRAGISAAATEFIRRQAWMQLVLTGVAIATIMLLSAYLRRALRQYLEVKRRENSERNLRALGTMAATLAHEIRNPLGAMKGLTQLAQEEMLADHASQAMLSTVVEEARRLERLVTDLLTFARLPRPREQALDTADLLATVRTLVEGRLAQAQVELETSEGAGLRGLRSDPELLRQMLINVVINAIDASPAGGKVTLRASMDDRRNQLSFEVCDTGPGIPPGDPEELFQPFQTGKTKGTGLGLTVSRQIAESLGGSIHIANRPEGGARCAIRVPVGSS